MCDPRRSPQQAHRRIGLGVENMLRIIALHVVALWRQHLHREFPGKPVTPSFGGTVGNQ
jgi:hypothetical protein